jgi:hypothetical protein
MFGCTAFLAKMVDVPSDDSSAAVSCSMKMDFSQKSCTKMILRCAVAMKGKMVSTHTTYLVK